MSRRAFPTIFAVLLFSALSVSVWAKNDSADSLTASVKLTSPVSVGSTKLDAGDYKVTVEANKAKFVKNGKAVAEVPCTVKDLNIKINTTTFILDKDQLTEIQVAGKSKGIEFGGQ